MAASGSALFSLHLNMRAKLDLSVLAAGCKQQAKHAFSEVLRCFNLERCSPVGPIWKVKNVKNIYHGYEILTAKTEKETAELYPLSFMPDLYVSAALCPQESWHVLAASSLLRTLSVFLWIQQAEKTFTRERSSLKNKSIQFNFNPQCFFFLFKAFLPKKYAWSSVMRNLHQFCVLRYLMQVPVRLFIFR